MKTIRSITLKWASAKKLTHRKSSTILINKKKTTCQTRGSKSSWPNNPSVSPSTPTPDASLHTPTESSRKRNAPAVTRRPTTSTTESLWLVTENQRDLTARISGLSKTLGAPTGAKAGSSDCALINLTKLSKEPARLTPTFSTLSWIELTHLSLMLLTIKIYIFYLSNKFIIIISRSLLREDKYEAHWSPLQKPPLENPWLLWRPRNHTSLYDICLTLNLLL